MFPSELKQCYREISEDLRNTLSNYQTIYHNVLGAIDNEDGDEEALKSHLDFLNEQLVMFVALIKEQDRQIRELP
jgi:hypothetical protein